MTSAGIGLHVETGVGLRTYAALLPLNSTDLAAALAREADGNPWLDVIERPSAGYDAEEVGALCAGPTLVEHLELLLAAMPAAPPAVRRAASYIIGTLDDDGYLRDDLHAIARLAQVGDADAERALSIVQGFEPAGIGARTLGERFRLQLRDPQDADPAVPLAIALTHELEALAGEGAAAFARSRDLDSADLSAAIGQLRRCDPHPVRAFAPPPERLYPEIVIARDGDRLEARVDRDRWPDVRLATLDVPRGVSPAMREARVRARLVVDALARRRTTLERLAIALLDRQRAYFASDGDVALLVPLSGRDLARDLGCAESTISRALSARYAATAFGTIALRSLLVRRPGSVDLTTRAVRECVRDAIVAAPHLSDAAIARILSLRGVRLARRTVAKYRHTMGLPVLRVRVR